MATNTYVALATVSLGSDVTSFTISSIPATYTHLIIVGSYSTNSAVNLLTFQVGNNTVDPNNNYSYTALIGNGSTASSNRYSNQTSGFISHTQGGTTTAGGANFIAHFHNYSSTTTNKTILCRANQVDSTYPAVELNVNLWRSNSAINIITFAQTGGAVIKAGSTFTVYGIANANTFAKATGGIITEDSSYTYHIFGSTGSFTPKQALTGEVLVVAGGGGGGAQGGGGGAGGLVYSSSVSLASGTTYTATVGSGGAAVSGVPGTDGTISSFSGTGLTTISATGGGGGGSGNSGQVINGRNGGSGGGGGIGGAASGGTAVSGQGNAGGGAPGGGGNYPGGGGGGAAVAGGTPATNTSPAGNGGNGSAAYDAWGKATTMGEAVNGTYYFAGGGGGGIFYNPSTDGTAGLGGYGGGTAGKGQNYVVSNAKANTGGGGGGVGHPTLTLAGKGGSGIVIVRYPK